MRSSGPAPSTGPLSKINANPYRLDRDWRWHGQPGTGLRFNPDGELDLTRWVVLMARAGSEQPKLEEVE